MNLKPFFRGFWNWTKRNSPKLLAAGAIIAEATGFYFMHKEAPIVRKKLNELGPDAKLLEKVKVAAPVYWPAALMLLISSGCVVGGCVAGERKAAVLATLYSASEAGVKRLEEKLVNELGPEKAQDIHDKIAEDLVKENPPSSEEIEETGFGHELFHDPYTGRWFHSSLAAFEKNNVDFNEFIQRKQMWGSYNDWLEFQNREKATCGDIVGWNIEHLFECYTRGDKRTKDGVLYYEIEYFEKPRLYDGKFPRPYSDQDCCYIN